MTYVPKGKGSTKITELPKADYIAIDTVVGEMPDTPTPTLDQALADVRAREAKVTGLSMRGELTVTYGDGYEHTFKGCTIAQLVPFSELLLHSLGLTVPTIECPNCLGKNLRNCPTCGGKGRVLASQVTSQEAARSPSLNRYKP